LHIKYILYQNKKSRPTRKCPSGKLPPLGPVHPEILLDIHVWRTMISWLAGSVYSSANSYWPVCRWAYPSIYQGYQVSPESGRVVRVAVVICYL